MPNRLKIRRSSVAGNRPATNPADAGELYVNMPDAQLGVSDIAAGAPLDLIGIRYHSATAAYILDDIVVFGGDIYKCINAHTAKVFDLADWEIATASVGTSVSFDYEWSTSTIGDPGSGRVALSVSPPAVGAATFRVNKTNAVGNDISFLWVTVNTGDIMGFQEATGDREEVYFEATGPPVDLTTYYDIPVTVIGTPGAPENLRAGVVSFLRNPDNKIPVGGAIEQVLDKTTAVDFELGWRYRMFWKGPWASVTYQPMNVVTEDGWQMVANRVTTDHAAPQPTGSEFWLYSGTADVDLTATARQVVVGQEYTAVVPGYITGYRVNVVAGNEYEIITVDDPGGINEVTFINKFVADLSGWRDFDLSPRIVDTGRVFRVLAIITEPSASPVTWAGDWDYQKPASATPPTAGQATHPNSDLDVISFHYNDNAGADRSAELLALQPGEVIRTGTSSWGIQSVTDMTTYVDVQVSPARQEALIGVQTFTFETTAAVTMTYFNEVDYWLTAIPAGAGKGLLAIDDSWDAVVADDDAYGVDLRIQYANISPDWDVLSVPEIVGGGIGAASFLTLTDTPTAYTGQASNVVQVNLAEDALEFGLPLVAPPVTYIVADEAALLALPNIAQGDIGYVQDIDIAYQNRAGVNATINDWITLGSFAGAQTVADQTALLALTRIKQGDLVSVTADNITYANIAGNNATIADWHAVGPTVLPVAVPWAVITADTTAVAGGSYAANTTAAGFNLTLPATPVVNDWVELCDYLGTFGTNNLTVVFNGNPIMGLSEDMVCDLNHESCKLVYVDATQGWVITGGK